MKFIWHNYLIFSLDICVHETPTEIDLNPSTLVNAKNIQNAGIVEHAKHGHIGYKHVESS